MLRARINDFKEACLLFLGTLAALPASQSGLRYPLPKPGDRDAPLRESALDVTPPPAPAAVGAWVTTPTNTPTAAWMRRDPEPHGIPAQGPAHVAPPEGTPVAAP